MKVYLANSLFSESDQMYNKFLASEIRNAIPDVSLYVPQENESINNKELFASSLAIYNADNMMLDDSDVMVSVIDGVEIDSGVVCEIGRFAALCELDKERKRTILGLYSDIRQNGTENSRKIEALIHDSKENQFMYRNLYVIGAVKRNGRIFYKSYQLVNYLKTLVFD